MKKKVMHSMDKNQIEKIAQSLNDTRDNKVEVIQEMDRFFIVVEDNPMKKIISMEFGEYQDDLTNAEVVGWNEAQDNVVKYFEDEAALNDAIKECEDKNTMKVLEHIQNYHKMKKRQEM